MVLVKVVINMNYISEREFDSKMKQIKTENISKQRRALLKEEKRKYEAKHKLPSASKLVLLGVILLCIQIVFFCEYAMLKLGDASSMYVLIGIPVALTPIIWGYYSKSKAENTSGGIVFETAMAQLNVANSENEVSG